MGDNFLLCPLCLEELELNAIGDAYYCPNCDEEWNLGEVIERHYDYDDRDGYD